MRRVELGPMRHHHQQRRPRRLGDLQIQQLARGRVEPVRVLHHHQHRAPGRQRPHAAEQRLQQPLAPTLGRQVEFGPAAEGGHRQQLGDQRHVLGRGCERREQGFQLGQARLRWLSRSQARRALQAGDDGAQRAVRVLGRAAEHQVLVHLRRRQRLPQRRSQAGLADAGLAAQQHHLPLARAGAAPAAEQQFQLLLAPDQRRGMACPQRLEPALDGALGQRAPGPDGVGQAVKRDRAEIGAVEQRPGQPPRGVVQHHRARPGQRLQPRREVGRLAHHAALARLALAQDLAHHHRPRGDPDARGERARRRPRPATAAHAARPALTARSASSSCARGQPK
jgi:hypothetical protein